MDRHPPTNGDPCSADAAESMRVHAPRLRRQVWLSLRMLGSATCDELEALTGLAHQTASARLNELANTGCIVRTDERRKTRSGRSAWVYRSTALEPV